MACACAVRGVGELPHAGRGGRRPPACTVAHPPAQSRTLASRCGTASRRFLASRVVNVGSVAGVAHQPTPTHAYDASKAALHHLTRKFASELAPDLTVNAVAPGFVPSRMSRGLATWGLDFEKIAGRVPLGRVGCDRDMAGVCLFLASPAAAWISGAIVPVDGGHLARGLDLPAGED